MARARKSHESDEEKTKTRLEPPFGASGDNPYVVYCDLKRESDEYARVLILNFKAKYAARFMLSRLIMSDEWEWVDPIGGRKCIKTSSGVRVSMFGDDLAMLLDYEPTGAEAEWRDQGVEQNVLRFKYGSHDGMKKNDPIPDSSAVDDDADPAERHSDRAELSNDRRGQLKPKREDRPKREPRDKPDTVGHVSANDIAKELKVEGREVRAVLRSLKLEKPEHGWSWPKEQADRIRTQIVAALHEPKEKKGKKK